MDEGSGLEQARAKMRAAGVGDVAVEVFSHYYRQLQAGATGMVPESSIEPVDSESLADAEVDADAAVEALRGTVVIKLNGGLGTSMGMDRAKSLLEARPGLTFLDIIVGQVLDQRRRYDARLPLLFMDSFRTSQDTLAALAAYPDLPVDGLPLDFLQNKEPKLLLDDLTPASHPSDPELEWCPPGHGDLYTVLHASGLVERLLDLGYARVFVANSDNLGATADPQVAGWFAASGAPFMIEAVRRTASDRKGGHFARRLSDGRIVLRETAQTLPQDREALADLERHRFCSTNNLWFDLAAMHTVLTERGGVMDLPLIRNVKSLDPTDSSTPQVVQVECAMGAAIEVFEGARTVEVSRDRFVPVKTTNDLLVLRSDVYRLGEGQLLERSGPTLPYVDLLGEHYAHVQDFDRRFPDGPPSLVDAESLSVQGDWTFGPGVVVRGAATLPPTQSPQQVAGGTVLDGVGGLDGAAP